MMEHCCDPVTEDKSCDSTPKIVMHPLYFPKLSPWFDLRVFYVRVSNCDVDESMPEHLTLNHTPLSPNSLLEVNGKRSGIYSECVSSSLRRDRVDKKSEEATFVTTYSIRMTGSVRFEVFDGNEILLTGVLELFNNNSCVGDSMKHSKKWSMKCQSMVSAGSSFLNGKQRINQETLSPMIEVYVAGCFSGTPIILTKTLQHTFRKKHQNKLTLDSIPEYETKELKKEESSESGLEVADYQDYKGGNEEDIDYNSVYSRGEYTEGEGGELSWFNAGVTVGVGIGLGICLGVGIGVGILVRSYQSTAWNFKRRLV